MYHNSIESTLANIAVFEQCLHLTQVLLGGWAILSGLEWLANIKMFRSDGLLAWRVLRLRTGITLLSSGDSIIGSPWLFATTQCVRVLVGIFLIVTGSPIISLVALSVLAATCGFINMRACFGGDGSDQMGMIVSVGALLISTGIYFADSNIAYAGVLFIGGQATLAYFVAGASKVISGVWRSGAAVSGVMHTTTFGHAWASRIMSGTPTISFYVGWIVMLTEMFFPFVLISPDEVLIFALLGFTFFHLSNAYFMGLNSFVLAFLATYPSLIKLNVDIRHLFFY